MHKRLDTKLCSGRVPLCDTAPGLGKARLCSVNCWERSQTKMPLLLALMLVVNPHAAHVISLIAMTCTDYLTEAMPRCMSLSPDRAAVKVAKYLAR